MTKIKHNFNHTSKSTASPFSLRLSLEERKRLEQYAAGLSLGEYIRQRIFTQGHQGDESLPKRRTRGKHPVKDHKILSQLLGELGRSRLASNMNQIAKALNIGSLELTPETETALLEACADIYEMRNMLIKALGLKD
ncbi:MAG: hypothetical protein V3U75_05630 [Methylococcaceae bacterium]